MPKTQARVCSEARCRPTLQTHVRCRANVWSKEARRTFAEKHDVVKQVEGLRCRLQQSHHYATLPEVYQVCEALYNLERGAAIQPSAYLCEPPSSAFSNSITNMGCMQKANNFFSEENEDWHPSTCD